MYVLKTSERSGFDLTKTHYFKASYDQIKEVYLEYLKNNGYKIVSINDDYFEIYAEKPHMEVISKIIMQNPKETSIDFHINSEFLFGNKGKAIKVLSEALKYIENKYELKGLSLHISD